MASEECVNSLVARSYLGFPNGRLFAARKFRIFHLVIANTLATVSAEAAGICVYAFCVTKRTGHVCVTIIFWGGRAQGKRKQYLLGTL